MVELCVATSWASCSLKELTERAGERLERCIEEEGAGMRRTGLAERSLLKNLVSCSSFAVLDLLGVTARSMALPSRFTEPLTRITWARDSGTDLGGVEGEFEL